MPIAPLDPSKLFTPSGADELGFDTTDALESLEGFPGQERAIEAIEFWDRHPPRGLQPVRRGVGRERAPLAGSDLPRARGEKDDDRHRLVLRPQL